MLTDRGAFVLDPFAGSCVTGEVCERLGRRWTCIELRRDYCEAAQGRFVRDPDASAKPDTSPDDPSNYYRLPRPGILWNNDADAPLADDGGRKRQPRRKPPQNGTDCRRRTEPQAPVWHQERLLESEPPYDADEPSSQLRP